MSLKDKLKELYRKNKLKIIVTEKIVLVSLIVFVPLTMYYFYTALVSESGKEYHKMEFQAVEVENEIRKLDGLDELIPEVIEDVLDGDEKITINNKITQEQYDFDTHDTYPNISEAKKDISLFFLELILHSYKDKIETVKNLDINFDKENRIIYANYSNDFNSPSGTYGITIERDVTRVVSRPIHIFLTGITPSLIWMIVVWIIAIWNCFSVASKILHRKMVYSFEVLEKNHYRGRIPNSGDYGIETYNVIERMNQLLKHKDNVIQTHIDEIEDMSHELGNNLTAMKQSVDMIRMFGLSDTEFVEEQLCYVDQNISRITNMSTAIKNLSKLDRASHTSKSPIRLHDLVDGYIMNKERTFRDYNFVINYDSEDPILCIDPEHFYLAFNPIVENAVRYSLNTKDIDIRVLEEESPGHIIVSVRNFGIGIEEDEIPKLFTRRYRGVHSSDIDGTGLGLHIAMRAMQLCGGEIKVSVKHIRETTFSLVFPK